MKKQHLFPLLAVILLATGLASAQLNSAAVKADIPFDFIAGKASLPAGEYRVSTISGVGTLAVAGPNSSSALVGSHAVQANAVPNNTKLIFHRYGDRYFLYQVWVQGEQRGRELPQTKLEQELASRIRFNPVAVLAHR